MITLTHLIDNGRCYELVRQFRWPDGVCCPKCASKEISKRGKDEAQKERQRYVCKDCGSQFDDLTDSVFAGRHQPLRVWVGCLYLMGLNLSNQQISKELDLDKDTVQEMTTQLRQAIKDNQPEIELSEEVEIDEVYITAGHKGHPEVVKKKVEKAAVASSKGFGDAGRSKRKSRRFLG